MQDSSPENLGKIRALLSALFLIEITVPFTGMLLLLLRKKSWTTKNMLGWLCIEH